MTPITVEWDDDTHKTIVMRYHTSYTWEELEAIVQQLYDMLNSVSYKVGVMVVFNPRIKAPFSNDMMSKMRNILTHLPPNISLFCTVGMGNSVTRALMNALLKVYPTPYPILSVGMEDAARKALAKKQEERN